MRNHHQRRQHRHLNHGMVLKMILLNIVLATKFNLPI